jgi:diketogulonate reductase-like aldo/keto reductase
MIPDFIYGTAWKEENTEDLTYKALQAGFTAIDTANQRKHYFEEGVGLGIEKFLASSSLKRSDLFLQTKYTYARGQDHRKPYEDSDSFSDQVKKSFESSLLHLKTDYIDSLVLHGPYSGHGITDEDKEVWASMETLQKEGKVKVLGLSNTSADQLKALFEMANVKPTYVQNRCYASTGWDIHVRDFCKEHHIHYQGFSLLTANVDYVTKDHIKNLSSKYQKTIPQIIFKFSQQVGMVPLTGTSQIENMKMDLDIKDFFLSVDDISSIEKIALN